MDDAAGVRRGERRSELTANGHGQVNGEALALQPHSEVLTLDLLHDVKARPSCSITS